jgi:hypothetical protein
VGRDGIVVRVGPADGGQKGFEVELEDLTEGLMFRSAGSVDERGVRMRQA